MTCKRLVLMASICIFSSASEDALARRVASDAEASRAARAHGRSDMVEVITIKGNHRIETGTILSYMVVQPGDRFSADEIDRTLKTLYATGLFSDVTINRAGNELVVNVVENPIVNRIAFEGNSAVKDADLQKEVALRPRAVFSSQAAAADRQKLLDLYASKARYGATVIPQIIKLSHNRVDVIYKINESRQTLVYKVVFVGNKAFSQARLASVISSKETEWYRFFSSSDEYNPERMKYDAELMRRFYLHNGYVDFRLENATGELSADRKNFIITFTVHEGPRYHIGKMDVSSSLKHVKKEDVTKYIELFPHQWYDGTAITKNATSMQEKLQANGHPFAMVRTDIARNPEKKTVDLLFEVMEGPKVYVERIDINGNTVTKDDVIRRQLPMAEGDPYTPFDKKYSKASLQDLGFFKSVSVDQSQGSAPDKSNIGVNVVEKPTGEFSLGGGYATDVGPIGNGSVKQHNLLGTGMDAGVSGSIAYWQKQANVSFTDPYFLGRNIVAGADIFWIQNTNQTYQSYNQDQIGMTFRFGYAFNNYLSQSWSYSLIDRHVSVGSYLSKYATKNNDYAYVPSIYVKESIGWSLLSQLSTTLSYDRRDNRMTPRRGFVLRLTGDFAGLGGNVKYARGKADGEYYVPLDSLTGTHDWGLQFKAGAGYMGDWSNSGDVSIIDNFYLGGANLRGFLQGGAGPRSAHELYYINGQKQYRPIAGQEDLIGGRFIYTASAQLNFPLPAGDAIGISGRYFIDAGSLSGLRLRQRHTNPSDSDYTPISGNSMTPRVSTGFGITWKSPFGMVNIDAAVPIRKSRNDRLYPLRFGFGQQF